MGVSVSGNFHYLHAGADLFVGDSPGAPICVVGRFWLAVSERQRLLGRSDTKFKRQICLPHES